MPQKIDLLEPPKHFFRKKRRRLNTEKKGFLF